MRVVLVLATISTLGLSACTNSDDPQLSMCQAVVKQLSNNTVSSWDSNSNTDNDRNRVVNVGFTNSSGQAGTVKCHYPKHENGTIDTAPTRVVWNGEPVDQSLLLSASGKASAELLAGTYKNTVEKTTVLAGQAAIMAKDAAEKGSVIAGDVAEKAKEAAAIGTEMAKDAAAKGTEMAKDAAAKGSVMAQEAAAKGTELAKDAAAKGSVMAQEAAAKGTELAKDAAVLAGELADKAKEAAAKGAQVMQDLQEQQK